MLGTRDREVDKTDGTLAFPEVAIWRESPILTKGVGTQIHAYKRTLRGPSCAAPTVKMRKQTQSGAGAGSRSPSKEVAGQQLDSRFPASRLSKFAQLGASIVD